MPNIKIHRRGFLSGVGGATLAALPLSYGSESEASSAAPLPPDSHPSRETIFRGGHVLSMDAKVGELAVGDVHVRDGQIIAVGERIESSSAEIIEASDAVVMPGFVDVHWHMWNSIWKGLDEDSTSYFRRHSTKPFFKVTDHYLAVRQAALEGINAGITTCHNWGHGARNLADFEAANRALVEVGIRARTSFIGASDGTPISRADLVAAKDWIAKNGQNRLQMGLLLDGLGDNIEKQVAVARELGLRPITSHENFLAFPKLLGKEFIYTHGTDVTDADLSLMRERGVKFGLCPATDPMIGDGLPPIYKLLQYGFPLSDIGFSVDVNCQTPADPFASLRTIVNASRIQQAQNPSLMGIVKSAPKWVMNYRDALKIGTTSGANVLGLADSIGSLTPGKRADIIVVRLNSINLMPSPNADKARQIVQLATPENVDTVMVDGIVRKRGGRLLNVDVKKVSAELAEAQTNLIKRASGG